jgi:hypothetical protein
MKIVGYVVKSGDKFIAVDMSSGGYIYQTDLCYCARIFASNKKVEAQDFCNYWNRQQNYCACDLVVKPLYMED